METVHLVDACGISTLLLISCHLLQKGPSFPDSFYIKKTAHIAKVHPAPCVPALAVALSLMNEAQSSLYLYARGPALCLRHLSGTSQTSQYLRPWGAEPRTDR